MAQINKPNLHFNTKLYTGNASYGHGITGVGFQPDFVWIKRRDGNARNHELYDAVRGTDKAIYSSSNGTEVTGVNLLHSFDSDGFTVDDHAGINSSNNFVSWNWKANGQGSSNTDGSINTTYTSANTTAGFSISTYTGNGSAGTTIGHGLGVIPKVIIVKKRNGSPNWAVYHEGLGTASRYLELNTTAGRQTDNGVWDGATPTTSVFYVGGDNKVNSSGDTYVAYCFAEKKGYSKFGYYTGNGNTDGIFIYTGFKPAFFLVKNTQTTEDWMLYDNKRDPINPLDTRLRPNRDLADTTNTDYNIDFISNGIKLRAGNSAMNGSGNTMIYMAFAKNPIVGSNDVPVTAE